MESQGQVCGKKDTYHGKLVGGTDRPPLRSVIVIVTIRAASPVAAVGVDRLTYSPHPVPGATVNPEPHPTPTETTPASGRVTLSSMSAADGPAASTTTIVGWGCTGTVRVVFSTPFRNPKYSTIGVSTNAPDSPILGSNRRSRNDVSEPTSMAAGLHGPSVARVSQDTCSVRGSPALPPGPVPPALDNCPNLPCEAADRRT